MLSLDGNQLWCPSQSLWSLVVEYVSGSELPKIRTALGNSLVDMYAELHSEAEMWHKMWQESQQGNNSSSRAGTPLKCQQGSPLADPPAVKELVRAEVKMLLQTLRERAGTGGRDCEELLFRYKPEMVNYALGHHDSCYKSCANPEGTDDGSRPSSHCSVQSNAEDEIEAVRDKLNVTDIDQVVDRLKSVLVEECQALKKLIKLLKENIKQVSQSKCDKAEPTLAELRELRGAIQSDLELFPSSFAASQPALSPLPLKESKNRIRLLAGQRVSEETKQALSTTSTPRRPHPPPPLCHTKPRPLLSAPRPPLGAPPSKTSASVKPINSSLPSQTHGQLKGTSAFSGLKKTQTPLCRRITLPSLPGPGINNIIDETTHHCSLSPEQDSAGLHCRTITPSPGFQIKTPGISTIHGTHLSSHRTIQRPGRRSDSSPHTERKSNPACRSKNISAISLSPHCDAGHSVSTKGESKTHKTTCGGGSVSATRNDRGKGTLESLHSCAGSKKTNSGIDRTKTGHLGKDVTQQQSLVATL